jgi:hypothetical protein
LFLGSGSKSHFGNFRSLGPITHTYPDSPNASMPGTRTHVATVPIHAVLGAVLKIVNESGEKYRETAFLITSNR